MPVFAGKAKDECSTTTGPTTNREKAATPSIVGFRYGYHIGSEVVMPIHVYYLTYRSS